MTFNNKVVIVTGASLDIGAATALLFASEGAAVAKQIEALGKKPLIIQADLSKEAEAATVILKTLEQFGKLDVLLNNAGVAAQGTVMDGKALKAYGEVMKTNVRAVIQLTSDADPHLAKTKGNVNISSALSFRPTRNPRFLRYCVFKAALDHFTRNTAMELASSGVRVNTVNPGPVGNEFISNNNFGDHHPPSVIPVHLHLEGCLGSAT